MINLWFDWCLWQACRWFFQFQDALDGSSKAARDEGRLVTFPVNKYEMQKENKDGQKYLQGFLQSFLLFLFHLNSSSAFFYITGKIRNYVWDKQGYVGHYILIEIE